MRECLAALTTALFLLPVVAQAQTDEIQVYDASIAGPGIFNLTWHNNYNLSAAKVPDFPGGIVPDHAWNGVAEWAYGVKDWFEAGLYAPLYTISSSGNLKFAGTKLRALFVVPDAVDKTFFYGINFEFSYNSTSWDDRRFTSEIRPIVGVRLGKIDIIVNPILDNSYEGFSRLDFAPSSRIAYHANDKFAVALEEYDDFGPLRHFFSSNEQSHQLFAVADYDADPVSIEAGIGFGLTQASDKLVLKLILSHDLS